MENDSGDKPRDSARLREAAFNQPQITDASHLVVFAVEKKIDEAYVDEFVSLVSKTRDVPAENLKGYRDMMTSFIARFSQTERDAWAGKQAYIALGTALVAAAERKIDSTPMEGFSHEAVDTVLELEKHGLGSAVILALGYRAADDETAHYKKVRFPREDMVIDFNS